MLSEDYIITCSDKITNMYNSFVDYTIQQIAKELKDYYDIDEINRRANILINSGHLKSQIIKKIAKLNNMAQSEVAKILEKAGKKTIAFDDSIYKEEGFEPIPFTASTEFRNILEGEILKTSGELKNLTATTADKVQEQFVEAVNNAELQVQTGLYDYNTAIGNAIKTVVENGGGTKVTYQDGKYKTQLDVAVRRSVLTGVSRSANELQLQRAKEMKAPYADTSAHEGARSTHQVWQGRRFSIFNDGKFPPFQPVLEQLNDYNCRHSWYPVMRADAPMARDSEELNKINSKTVTANGKKYTYYEAEQRLRQMERTVRKYKREKMALKECGLDNSSETLKVRQWNAKIKQFCTETGLKRRPENERIFYNEI